MKIFFCKLRDALGFHITPTTEQPKGRCVCALGLRSWAPGTSFAEKTARRNVAPEHWVFLAGTGGGLWFDLQVQVFNSPSYGLPLHSHMHGQTNRHMHVPCTHEHMHKRSDCQGSVLHPSCGGSEKKIPGHFAARVRPTVVLPATPLGPLSFKTRGRGRGGEARIQGPGPAAPPSPVHSGPLPAGRQPRWLSSTDALKDAGSMHGHRPSCRDLRKRRSPVGLTEP